MRLLLAGLVVYVLCLVQTSIGPFGPDLVLLALFVLALHENRFTTTLIAFFAGLCLDLTAASSLGAGAVAYAALTYGVASLHSLVYRGRWYLLVLVLVGLAIRHAVAALAGAGLPAALPLAVSFGLTLLLVFPADRLASRLLYREPA